MRERSRAANPAAVENGASWSDGDDKPAETVDIARGTPSARPAEAPPERGSMSQLLQDLGDGNRDDDDDIPAERTRIEANPLQRVEELDKVVAKKTPPPAMIPSIVKKPQMPPSGALPLSDPPKIGARPTAPVTTPSLSPNVPSGRFPDLANLPTMVASDDVPELAETQINKPLVVDTTDALARTNMDMQTPMNGAPGMQSGMPQPPLLPPIQPQLPPDLSYPVMDKEMHQQIHSGATVFPSPSKRGTPTGAHDPQHAANMASPVGQHYGDQVDWDAAAAAPARAIPPWMLGLLFLAAIGVALGITIAIAKLVS